MQNAISNKYNTHIGENPHAAIVPESDAHMHRCV